MRNIIISDYTLRLLGEKRGAGLLFREKTAVAHCLDNCGINMIELDAVKNVKEDTVICKTIAKTVENSTLCIPIGDTADGAETAWNCICDAHDPCLQVCMPVSTVQMEYRYHVKDAGMIKKVQSLCSAASALCKKVEFVAEDATRADKKFLIDVCSAAKESGAYAVTLCDDAGIVLPDELAQTVREIKEQTGLSVYVRTSDEINLAAACALAAVTAGADGVKTASVGENILLTQKFASALKVRGESIGVTSSLRQTEIYRDIESMIHLVGNDTSSENDGGNDILLDRDSTLTQVNDAVTKLGYELSSQDLGYIYETIKHLCLKKESVGGRELEAIIASNAMQVPSTYHLENYLTTTGTLSSISKVTLRRGEDKTVGVAEGNGAVDSAFKAIEQIIGYHYELDDFQIQAVTGGKEALGSALVRLRCDGKLYSGNGISGDIVSASIRAYLNAVNKIVYNSENEQ